MTWNELNDWSDGGLADYLGVYGWQDLQDESPEGDGANYSVWHCSALDGFVEVLEQIRNDMPANYDAEYTEYTNMIKRLQAVR